MTWKSPNGQLLYRIGDVMISTNSENPSTFFGGTWQLLCPGRTLVCVDTNDRDFNKVKKTGGSKYLHSHNHSIDSSGTHTHTAYSTSAGSHFHATSSTGYREGANNWRTSGYTGTITNWGYDIATKYAGEHSHSVVINSCGGHSHVLSLTGSGNSQNLQPFMAVYIWVRIA